MKGGIDLLNIYWFKDNPVKPLEPVMYFTAILKAYAPNLIIADSGYGQDRNTVLYAQFPAAMWSCYWRTIKSAHQRVRFRDQWVEKSREVTVDKTTKVQRMLHKLKLRQIGMFPWSEKIQMLTKHIKNVRIMDMEDDGDVYQIATRIGDDHLGMALTYALIGVDKLTDMGKTQSQRFGFEFI